MVIDRPAPVKIFVIFRYFSAKIFVKSTFLATQEELEALLWICFTPRIVFLSFEGKTFFFEKKSSKKILAKKNLRFFLGVFGIPNFLTIHKNSEKKI